MAKTKRTGSHSTLVDSNSLSTIISFLEKSDIVKSYGAGIIVPKKPPAKTEGPTKITMTKTHLRIDLNSKSFNQEIHVYGNDIQKIAEEFARNLVDNGFKIKFGHHEVKKELKINRQKGIFK